MNYTMEELFPVIQWLSEKYTSKESTSITYEAAQQLSEAVLYCIREGEEQACEDNIPTNQNVTAKQAYEHGYKAVCRKAKKANLLYQNLVKEDYSYHNRAYKDTLVKGMPQFFLRYDARFQPQDELLTLDYPILAPHNEAGGIDTIYDYLQAIGMEQQFLSHFDSAFVMKTLQQYHTDYENLFINLCSVTLRAVLIHMLIHKSLTETEYTPKKLGEIAGLIQASSRESMEEQLLSALSQLLSQGNMDSESFMRYLKQDVIEYSYELKSRGF